MYVCNSNGAYFYALNDTMMRNGISILFTAYGI